MDDERTPTLSAGGSSKSPSTSPELEIPVQPAFFYPSGHNSAHLIDEDDGFLSPEQDPLATRGIPVFKPTLDEFNDFEQYMTRVELWGRKSGIVKIIPPKEWSDALPPVKSLLPDLKLRHPIEQHMLGQGGLFRQNNVEKRRTLSLKDWTQLCAKDDLKAYPIISGEVKTRGIHRTPRKPRNIKKAKLEVKEEEEDDNADTIHVADPSKPGTPELNPARSQSAVASDYPTPQSNSRDTDPKVEEATGSTLDPSSEDPFYATFDPRSSWLPQETCAEDYTPEACRELERIFWRTCGLGTPAQYGADMAGSLFTDETKHWNVANLPSFLSRLCKNKALPGVNTPYLYFGMWRATFAWHVEDMDLYSINYIHWGAPKYWYAIPSERSKAFEGVMKGYFPGDATECPQYLRHKSYLVSPTLLSQSSCRPNTVVQHQGEFVITFPRGYHAGFNLGLNCAESVNFALESWVELGRKAGVCNCVGDSVRIDVDSLLDDAEEQREEEHSEAKKKRRMDSGGSDEPKRKRIRKEPSSAGPQAGQRTSGAGPSYTDAKPRIRLPPMPPTPCCLCANANQEGLLRVHDSPQVTSSARPTMVKDERGNEVAVWRAHEQCARALPETWIDEVQGEKFVFGVDGIDKDRWGLKCSECTRNTLKVHGAKVQCTKGKCPKAFHVTCAMHAADVAYKELGEVEKAVLLMDYSAVPYPPSHSTDPAREPPPADEADRRTIKTIKKPIVEILCSQHNPIVLERKKHAKLEQIRKDVLALPPEARIRIRNSSGVCEVTVVSVNPSRENVTVIWSDGDRREFSWRSIVWGHVPEGKIVKTAENEMRPAKMPQQNGVQPQAVFPPSSSSAPSTSSVAIASTLYVRPAVPTATTYQAQTSAQYSYGAYYAGSRPYTTTAQPYAGYPTSYPGPTYYYASQPAPAQRQPQPDAGPVYPPSSASYPPGYYPQQPYQSRAAVQYTHPLSQAPGATPAVHPSQPAYYNGWQYQSYYHPQQHQRGLTWPQAVNPQHYPHIYGAAGVPSGAAYGLPHPHARPTPLQAPYVTPISSSGTTAMESQSRSDDSGQMAPNGSTNA